MALYAAGRQADALAAYERCRRALADQLGVDPAPPLRRVHAAVLAQQGLGAVAPRAPRSGRTCRNARGRSSSGRSWSASSRPRWTTGATGPWCCTGCPGRARRSWRASSRTGGSGRAAWRGGSAAEDPAGTAAGLADLAVALGIGTRSREEDTRAALWAELDRAPGWVLVFDNADEPAPAGALPAHRGARRRHHHLPRPGLATAGPAGPGAVADPRGVDHLRRRAQRRPGRRGRRRAGRAARRPSPCPAAGLRLRRADRHDRARLRAPLPRTASRTGRRRHHLGPRVRPAPAALAAGRRGAGDDVVPRGRHDRRRDAVAAGRRRRAGRAGSHRRAAAPVARRPQGADPARAPARAGRGARRARPGDRGGPARRSRADLPGRRRRRTGCRRPPRPGRGALRGAAAPAARPARRAGRGGAPLRRAGPVPRRRAGAHVGAAARRRAVRRGGHDHPARHAAVPARRGARRRGQAGRGAGPAPPRGRAARRRTRSRRARAGPRLQPPRPRPQLRRRHRGRRSRRTSGR